MANSHYNYEIQDFAGRTCIIITDLNLGGKSVTNDIENVVAEIVTKECIDPSKCMIVYGETGNWDGWDHSRQQFELLDGTNAYHAIRRWLKRQAENVTNLPNNKTKEAIMKSSPDELKRVSDPGDEQEED